MQHRKIEALGIAQDIKYLVSSEEAGREKPAKEMFDLCLEKLKLPPEHIWYVGDSFQKDVEGAMKAGMKAVWFQPEGNAAPLEKGGISTENSYLKVSDYTELTKLVIEELKKV